MIIYQMDKRIIKDAYIVVNSKSKILLQIIFLSTGPAISYHCVRSHQNITLLVSWPYRVTPKYVYTYRSIHTDNYSLFSNKRNNRFSNLSCVESY